ncbi:DeoR family transcriptional regulator [Micromonospora parastrephiae]|uniref:DeoR family transcriptional regulator n=1 Tax=Micromonospora parastrephiae TaxID=2806101 RepID=UPI001EE4D24C|nr:DeoR family transcriptional regulator [Micromonospora parastrephiae]
MGDQDAVRLLSPRRWRILSYLAQHGSASTLDVALVCAVSRLTAHRDLVWLHEAGWCAVNARRRTGPTPGGTRLRPRGRRCSAAP